MENQKPTMPLHNMPLQSTCPKPLIDNQIPTISVAQSSPEEFVFEIINSPMENQKPTMPLHNVPSQSTCPKPLVDNQIPTILVAQSSPEDFILENMQIKTEDEGSEQYEFMLPKLKPKPLNYRNLMNARMYHLVSPKSALMVFSELFQDVQIKLQKHPANALNCMSYTARLEIDGQMYTANDISMSEASEKACEKFLCDMLTKKINELSEKEKSPMEVKIEDGENDAIDEFPWEQFIKLAMHNLINAWKIPNASKAFNACEQEEPLIEHFKTEMKRIDTLRGSICNPTQLVHQLWPDVKFIHSLCSIDELQPPTKHLMQCVIHGVPYVGIGPSKKEAKRKCCIQVIQLYYFPCLLDGCCM